MKLINRIFVNKLEEVGDYGVVGRSALRDNTHILRVKGERTGKTVQKIAFKKGKSHKRIRFILRKLRKIKYSKFGGKTNDFKGLQTKQKAGS